MVLRFGQKSSSKAAGKSEDVTSLIARKNYARAIELIKQQLKSPRAEPRLRMQLADVLVLTGKTREAVMILTPLADEFAREGFAAKAIAVLKKIQKIDPTRREVEGKLASLIQEKQQQASVAISSPGPAAALEIGIEEIGFEPPAGGPIAVPVEDRPASVDVEPNLPAGSAATAPEPPQPFPKPEPPPPPQPMPAPEPFPPAQPTPAPREPAAPAPAPARHFEIEEAGIELEAEAEPPPEPPPAPARTQKAERPIIMLEPQPEPEPTIVPEPEPAIVAEPELSLTPEPVPVQPAMSEPEFVLDDGDEFQLDEGGETGEAAADEALEAPIEVEAEAEASQPVTDNVFVDELMSVLEEAFPSGLEAPFTKPIAPSPTGSAQIVVSPLFRHFSVDEMVAVIAGLNLRSCQRGEVIIREGEPGDRLFMLSSGKVKAFRKGPTGKQVPLAVLDEGAFFGEGAMLTGKPRTASIVALEECELLELDRATLDSIVQQHPHVMDVMREFAAQRQLER